MNYVSKSKTIQYLLYPSKRGNPELKMGQVVSVSNLSLNMGSMCLGQTYGQNMETVVDVSVKVGEETIDFKQLPANLSIANFGANGVVVSESREAMNAEVESHAQDKPGSDRKCPLP